MFLFVLENKYFTSIPENVYKRVQSATQEELEMWIKKILTEKFKIAELEA